MLIYPVDSKPQEHFSKKCDEGNAEWENALSYRNYCSGTPATQEVTSGLERWVSFHSLMRILCASLLSFFNHGWLNQAFILSLCSMYCRCLINHSWPDAVCSISHQAFVCLVFPEIISSGETDHLKQTQSTDEKPPLPERRNLSLAAFECFSSLYHGKARWSHPLFQLWELQSLYLFTASGMPLH